MFRFLAIVTLLVPLAAGYSGYLAIGGADPAINMPVLMGFHDASGSGSHDEERREMPSQQCCQLSCSPTFLAKASLLPFRLDPPSNSWVAVDEHNPRAFIIGRDPPIPRSLV